MTNYFTFTVYDRHGLHDQSFYLPHGDELQELGRDLAHDVFTHKHLLAMAYADKRLNMEILLPAGMFPRHTRERGVKSGRLMNIPFRLVEDLDEPMIAYKLKVMKLP